ncbi:MULTISPECIES: shikimate 5-dehydrogenase [Enterobacteriaceae]|uniref:shikimate 5-dehydrogenase n=1 Tax=Enterobacteriaceae TaxID=543 RepID=UPI000863211D|nr:shikimate 5-dehydrogenase [Klebsiella sp. LTGPAF-6F]AOV10025.1 shikimate 5-dehydrogenase [Klebsiella sp. LTGPAF-6F]
MTKELNKDTKVCMSLAARPSNFGTRFHNYLYDELGLDYIYKAFTTTDLPAAIGGVRALGIRGCGISMPFKEACIPLVDELDVSAKAINSINTVVNTDGYLKAYNTDYIAIATLLKNYQVPTDSVFALRGSGGMAKAVSCALKDAGFRKGYIVAINEDSGKKLAKLYGYDWRPNTEDIQADLLINATPIGMAGGSDANKLAYSESEINDARIIFDVVALPSITPLIRYAKDANKTVITGSEVFAIQAVEQFFLYTGVRPDDELFRKASIYSRQ